MRRVSILLFALLLPMLRAQDVVNGPQGEQIPGPSCSEPTAWNTGRPTTCRAADDQMWLKDVQHWREERAVRVGLNRSEYDRANLRWTQNSFIQPQMMVHDRFFYDVTTGGYTVDRYLDDVQKRYGGIDSVLVWHTYPNIGIDDRNQYDMFADLPGGTAGVRQMVADFHRRGVRVLFPVMVWDQGTRNEGTPDAEAISRELVAVGADGINGDTLDGVPRTFHIASENLNHPLALEPEGGLATEEMLAFNNMSWGYWKYNFIPSISRYKWLESRHMVNICNRWEHSHLDDLQHAFFNGVGFESWENIWGIWNGLTPRDAETVRRIGTLERGFGNFLISPGWEPHTSTQHFGVFASRWPVGDQAMWTVVNRNHYPVSGEQLRVPRTSGARYFDLWNGVELKPRADGDWDVLSFDIEANGYGSVFQTSRPVAKLDATLRTMKAMSARPLLSFSSDWKTLAQQFVEVPATKSSASTNSAAMVKIPGGDFIFRVNGIEIEGGNDEGVDVQYPWETSARRYHEHPMHLDAFMIDKTPVTNAEYKRFVDSSSYRPKDGHNYLRDWEDGTYPAGWDAKPVTWVSLEDARAYAAWAGKRLPHEWEWQYAAQGTDGRAFPWGNTYPDDFSRDAAVPKPDAGRTMQPASDVTAHPAGASAFGVLDMVGNVWQWTDEVVDEHTRTAILRGGSHYQPAGARWYFPQGYKLNEHGKYLLMSPGLDRSGAVGFRCVRDLPQ